jgi:hypothetical protein
MRRSLCGYAIAVTFAVFLTGCTSTPPMIARAQMPGGEFASDNETPKDETKKEENGKDDDKPKEPAKTLFEWAIGPERKEEEEPEEEEPIVTDRPDFTEASSTVGRGRVQLEAGYTYYRDHSGATRTITRTFPEALLRIGMFADWFELRFGETYVHSPTTEFGLRTDHAIGWSDLYVGAKFGLTEQNAHLPEMALVIQATLPTGAQSVKSDRILPGMNLLYGWDIVPDCLSAGGSLQGNLAIDDEDHPYVLMAKSFTIGYTLTEKLGAYTEWFAFFPTSAVAPEVTAQHYVDGGFTYKVTKDFQLDIRVGKGISSRAQDFFAGAGFAVRY